MKFNSGCTLVTICLGLSLFCLIKEMRDISAAINNQTSAIKVSASCHGMRQSLGQLDTAVLLSQAKFKLEYKIGESIYEISDTNLTDAKLAVNEILADTSKTMSSKEIPRVTYLRGSKLIMPEPLEMIEDLYGLTFLDCHGI